MDEFFAAVERLDHPEWVGRPIIVGGSPDGRGVVSTASYEARVFGVRSAMPAAIAARLCPDAVWVRPRGERYMDVARDVRDIFDDVTPVVEPMSIDEAYLDVTPVGSDSSHPVSVAEGIRERVRALGITCSVGLGSSKTVAKIASDIDKPDGLTVVWPGQEGSFLGPLAAERLPGVGAVTQLRLARFGLHTLGDLAALDVTTARQVLGSMGPSLARRARGIDRQPVQTSHVRKSVSRERTFATDVCTGEEVRVALTRLAESVGRRLKRKGLKGRTVTVKLRFADFTTRTVQTTLGATTDRVGEFLPVALDLLDDAWAEGAGLRLLGVGLSGFEDSVEQLDLLDDSSGDDGRDDAIVESMEAVRERFGRRAISRGMPPPSRGESESREGSS